MVITLRADNIQVRARWQVSNANNAFYIDEYGDGLLYLTAYINDPTTLDVTVYLEDDFQLLNPAYDNLMVATTIRVEVMLGTISIINPPLLYAAAGVAEIVHIFLPQGGKRPYTYVTPDIPSGFAYENGTLSIQADVAEGEYRLTVEITDADNITAMAAATVAVIVLSSSADRMYLIGGEDFDSTISYSDVWSSLNGVHWFLATSYAFPPRIGHAAVVLDGVMYVIGGTDNADSTDFGPLTNIYNDIWSSSDGINWTLKQADAAFSPRGLHRAVVLNGVIYVIGGGSIDSSENVVFLGDVWSSANGVNWTLKTNAFPKRLAHDVAVLNGAMYVMGGANFASLSGPSLLNDVWASANGVQWTLKTASAAFGKNESNRYGFTAVTFKDKLYVIVGYGGTDGTPDVWSSSNGITWNKEFTFDNYFGDMRAVVLNDNLYVIGTREIWSSSDGANWHQVSAEDTDRFAFELIVLSSEDS